MFRKKHISKIQQPFFVKKSPLQNGIAYEKKGHWTQKEKLKYVIFIEHFKSKFTSKDNKKRFCRIFKVMSDFIKTRTHNQCRSHHQKMEKQKFQVSSIISNVSSKYHPRLFKEYYERYVTEIQNLDLDGIQQGPIRMTNIKLSKEQFVNKTHASIKRSSSIIPKPSQEKLFQKQAEKKTIIKQQYIPLNIPSIQIEKLNKKTADGYGQDENPAQEVQEMPFEYALQDLKNPISVHLQSKQFPISFSQFQENHQKFTLSSLNHSPLNNIQSLDSERLNSLNKASFHYNQWQIQMRNAAQYEKAKLMLLEQYPQSVRNGLSTGQFANNTILQGFTNLNWNFNPINKRF